MRFFIAFGTSLVLAIGQANAQEKSAEYAVRWDPANGGPNSIASVLASLKLEPRKAKELTVQYYHLLPQTGMPTGYKAIVRLRKEVGEAPEVMFKIRGPENDHLPDALMTCPLIGKPKLKEEIDISILKDGEVKRARSVSCTVESSTISTAIPTTMKVQPVGCTAKVERLKAQLGEVKFTIEHWRLAQGETYIEVSMKGADKGADFAKFTDVVKQLQALKVLPIGEGKTSLAMQCKKDQAVQN